MTKRKKPASQQRRITEGYQPNTERGYTPRPADEQLGYRPTSHNTPAKPPPSPPNQGTGGKK